MLPQGFVAPLLGVPLLGVGNEEVRPERATGTARRDEGDSEYARLLERANDVEGPTPTQCAVVPCPPALLRCATGCVPSGAGVMPRGALPLTVALCPMALPAPDAPFFCADATTDAETLLLVPADARTGGAVRCAGCGAYINPYAVFSDGGRRWRCAVCGGANDVPAAYRSVLCRETGQRRDLALRPELTHGAVEYVAGPEHSHGGRAPAPPCHALIIDVSRAATASGVVRAVSDALMRWLDGLDDEDAASAQRRTRLALVLCDRRVTVVDLRSGCHEGTHPRLLSLAPEDCTLFAPAETADADSADAVLRACGCVCVAECRDAARFVAEHLEEMSADANEGIALYPAVAVARRLIAPWGGRIHVVARAPAAPCRGIAVPVRSDRALWDSAVEEEKGRRPRRDALEAALAAPADNADRETVERLAAELCGVAATVHVYAAGSGAYSDLATLALLAERTGGSVYHDPHFVLRVSHTEQEQGKEDAHVGRLRDTLGAALGRAPRRQAWTGVVRVRVPPGLRVVDRYGSFFRARDVLSLGAAAPASTATLLLAPTGTFDADRLHALQYTLLYTTGDGRRRVRVCTVPLAASARPADVYAALDADCLAAGLARMAAAAVSADRRALADVAAGLLVSARAIVSAAADATGSKSTGAPPAVLGALPLYVLALLKSRALAHGPPLIAPDARAAALHAVRTLPVDMLLLWLHPQLCDLAPLATGTDTDAGSQSLPLLPLTAESLQVPSAYLLDACDTLLVYCPRTAGAITEALLGDSDDEGTVVELPVLDTPLSVRVRALVAARMDARVVAGLARPQLVVQRTLGPRLAQYLVADPAHGVADYATFLRAVLEPK